MKCLILVLLCFPVLGCTHRINLSPDPDSQPKIAFLLETEGVNGILRIDFWKEGADHFLWRLDVGYGEFGAFEYGKIPLQSKQVFPKEGRSPNHIDTGTVFLVEVKYQFDTIFPPAANAASQTYRFIVSDERKLIEVGEVWKYMMPDGQGGQREKLLPSR